MTHDGHGEHDEHDEHDEHAEHDVHGEHDVGPVLAGLHTHKLAAAAARAWLGALERGLHSARLSKQFPARRPLQGTLRALQLGVDEGVYSEVYVDARSGLPNLASFTRVVTDRVVAAQWASEAESNGLLEPSSKWRYRQQLLALEVAPVDRERVAVKRATGGELELEFEFDKLTGVGEYVRVGIELVHKSDLVGALVRVDEHGTTVDPGLKSTMYRLASYDAEVLFARLHELRNVTVRCVRRCVIGPVWGRCRTPDQDFSPGELPRGRLTDALQQAFATAEPNSLAMVASFATDVAGVDVADDRSNDPLMRTLADTLPESEAQRYAELRARHPFRVFKDRKFVVTRGLEDVVTRVCAASGTRNIILPL